LRALAGGVGLPEGVDQAVRRDDLAAVQEEDCKQRALLPRSDLERPSPRECLEGAEDAELQRVFRNRQATPLSTALKRRASRIQALLKRTHSPSIRNATQRNATRGRKHEVETDSGL